MATRTGTYDISMLLAVRFQSAAEYGMNTINEVLRADLQAHNQITMELVQGLCAVTTDRQRISGTSADTEMVEVDEYGRGPTQKMQAGQTVGFPLQLFQYAVGWTQRYFQLKTPADVAEAALAAQKAHVKRVQRSIKLAIFDDTNYTFQDFLVDKIDLAVKRFYNADGASIPDGPNGETFDGSTHTHYLANASLTTGKATELIETVVEHGHGSGVVIYINKGDEAAWRALTGFVAYQDPRLIFPTLPATSGTTANLTRQTLDISRLDNRAIGIYGAAEIWVKPWVPRYYAFCTATGDPQKPLAFRQQTSTSLQGLRIAAEMETFPLYARYMEAEFGVGVWTRSNGAVLYFNNGTWADPTL